MTTPNQPGWYDDPQDSNAQRYWDGQDWTPHRQRKPRSTPAPAMSPPPQQPPPAPSPPPPSAYAPTQPAPRPPMPPSGGAMPPPPPPPPPHKPHQPMPGMPPPGMPPGAEAGPPGGLPPPAWPPPPYESRPDSGQAPPVSFATIQANVAKSATAWLLIGGSVVAVISLFLTWFTVKGSALGIDIISKDVSPPAYWKLMVLLMIAGAGWLAWPFFAGARLSVQRLIGLSVVVILLAGLAVTNWYTAASESTSDDDSAVSVSPGFGLLLYLAAVVAIAVGVVRIWMSRSNTRGQAY